MQILQAFEEFMGTSVNFTIIPHLLKKLLASNYSGVNRLKKSPHRATGRADTVHHLNPAINRILQSPFFTNWKDKANSDLTLSNVNSPNSFNDKDMACIPIVTNGKYMGMIVTSEENTVNEKVLQPGLFNSSESEQSVSFNTVRKVVHEVNTPLNIVKNYIHILGNKLSAHDIAQDEIRIIKEEIDRISHLLNQLNTSSTPKNEKIEYVDINAQIEDLVQIMKEPLSTGSGIRIQVDVDQKLPLLYTTKDNIKQIFVNLIKNSIDAMPDGGEVNIRTRYYDNSDHLNAMLYQDHTGHIEVTVSDTGLGIPVDIKRNIFEPFISSKKGDHSGMGLSIVRNIVGSLDGIIRCSNNKGNGATFTITLPLHHTVYHRYGVYI